MANQNRIQRKKINLLRKIMGKRKGNEMVWFIGLEKNKKTFYVTDYDDDNNTIMWSGKKSDGISFKTERGLHRFIQKHLNSRTDIFLIQAPPN